MLVKQLKNEAKKQKGGFLGMLLNRLGTSLLGNMLVGKGAIAARASKGTIRAGESTIRVGQDF